MMRVRRIPVTLEEEEEKEEEEARGGGGGGGGGMNDTLKVEREIVLCVHIVWAHRHMYMCVCINRCMYICMNKYIENHNSLGREQPSGLDVIQSPNANTRPRQLH